jgi:hypothetical protein
MIRSAMDLSKDQELAIESLLGRPVSENEQISVAPSRPKKRRSGFKTRGEVRPI